MFQSDEKEALIFSTGTYETQIGLAGNDRPNYIVSNFSDKFNYLLSEDGCFNDCFFDFLGEFLVEKSISLEKQSVLFNEPLKENKKNRERIVSVLFEKDGVSEFFICNSGVLTSFSFGKSTCLLLDSAHSHSSVVPIHDGLLLKSALKTSKINGKFINDLIATKLKGNQILTGNPLYNLNRVKCAYFESKGEFNGELTLPDERKLSVAIGRDVYDEIMKEGFDVNSPNSFYKCIFDSISSVQLDIKRELIENIFVSGGNSLISENFCSEIKEKLRQIVAQNTKVGVRTHTSKVERNLGCFLGSSILASLSVFSEYTIKNEEYQEYGAGIVERKCA